MRRASILVGAWLMCGVAATGLAHVGDEMPLVQVEARIHPAGPLSVGVPARLQIDVSTSTWFAQPPVLPPIDLVDVAVASPQGSADSLTLNQGGVALTVLRYTYGLTPTAAGPIAIPALKVRVVAGGATQAVDVQSQPLATRAEVPAGAERIGLGSRSFAATAVRATQRFTQLQTPLRTGESVMREVTIEADGAQAMLMPPPVFADLEGAVRYDGAADVAALTDGRGGVTGWRRVDRASYVKADPGALALPPIEITWWNIQRGQVETLLLPGTTVDVVAAPASTTPFSIAADLTQLRQSTRRVLHGATIAMVAAAVLLMVALAALWRYRRVLGQRTRTLWVKARRRWLSSESYAWRRLRQSRHGDPDPNALYLWLRRIRGTRTLSAALDPLPPHYAAQADAFMRRGYGAQQPQWEGNAALIDMLIALRRRFKHANPSTPRHSLAPLNPRMPRESAPSPKGRSI